MVSISSDIQNNWTVTASFEDHNEFFYMTRRLYLPFIFHSFPPSPPSPPHPLFYTLIKDFLVLVLSVYSIKQCHATCPRYQTTKSNSEWKRRWFNVGAPLLEDLYFTHKRIFFFKWMLTKSVPSPSARKPCGWSHLHYLTIWLTRSTSGVWMPRCTWRPKTILVLNKYLRHYLEKIISE